MCRSASFLISAAVVLLSFAGRSTADPDLGAYSNERPALPWQRFRHGLGYRLLERCDVGQNSLQMPPGRASLPSPTIYW